MRLPDWEQRLNAFIESRRKAAFSWGDNDCGKFCFGAIEAMTGENPCPHDWATEDEARAIFGDSVKRCVSAFMGRTKGVLCARRGDLVIDKAGSMGICVGARVVTPTSQGLGFVPLEYFKRCWRVD